MRGPPGKRKTHDRVTGRPRVLVGSRSPSSVNDERATIGGLPPRDGSPAESSSGAPRERLLPNLARSASGCRRRNTRSRRASKRNATRVGDRAVSTSVRVALQCDGRLVDVEALAQEFSLDDRARKIIERLSEFGDESLGVHRFGAIHVAEINAGSAVGRVDQTTFVLSRRTRGSQIKFWWETENGGEGDLLRVSEPLDFWGNLFGN